MDEIERTLHEAHVKEKILEALKGDTRIIAFGMNPDGAVWARGLRVNEEFKFIAGKALMRDLLGIEDLLNEEGDAVE